MKRSSALRLCVALALTACGAAAPLPLPPGGDATDPAAVADQGPREDELRLTLFEAGAEPRRPLRYRYPIGRPEQIEISMRMTITIVVGETAPGAGPPAKTAELPTIKTVIRIDPLSVSPTGDLKYEFHVIRTTLGDDIEVPKDAREKLETELRRMDGTGGWALVTSRGLTKRSVYEIPHDVPPEVAQTMESVRQAVQQIATPLPAEAVGVGAKWETVSSVKTQLVKLTQTARYQLVESSGDRGALKIEVTQTAPSQIVAIPGGQPDVTWKLESLATSGSGTARFDLTRVVPTSEMQVQTKTALMADKGGETQRLTTNVQLGTMIRTTP